MYVHFLEVKLFVFSFLTMFFYVCSGCLLAQQNARALRTSANDNKEWQAIWTGGFEGLQKLNLRNVHQNSPKDVKNIRKFLGYVCAYKLYHQLYVSMYTHVLSFVYGILGDTFKA